MPYVWGGEIRANAFRLGCTVGVVLGPPLGWVRGPYAWIDSGATAGVVSRPRACVHVHCFLIRLTLGTHPCHTSEFISSGLFSAILVWPGCSGGWSFTRRITCQ